MSGNVWKRLLLSVSSLRFVRFRIDVGIFSMSFACNIKPLRQSHPPISSHTSFIRFESKYSSDSKRRHDIDDGNITMWLSSSLNEWREVSFSISWGNACSLFFENRNSVRLGTLQALRGNNTMSFSSNDNDFKQEETSKDNFWTDLIPLLEKFRSVQLGMTQSCKLRSSRWLCEKSRERIRQHRLRDLEAFIKVLFVTWSAVKLVKRPKYWVKLRREL